MQKPTVRGFTILELMVTITVLAILLGIGVPSFTDMIRRNRVTAETNELIATFAIARSEAVKRGDPIAICGSDNTQTACAGAADWSNGWIVFSDEGVTAGTIEPATETIIQRWPGPNEENIRVQTGAAAFLRYRSDGRTEQALGTSTTFTVAPTNCSAGDARAVTVIAAGRASSAAAACPP